MASSGEGAKPFGTLAAIIGSAAFAVATTLALFNSFLEDLVPPIDGAQLAIGMVSFATTIVLLALSLLIRKRLSVARQQWLAVGALAMVGLAFIVFFLYRDMVRDFVFAYPPDAPAAAQTQYIRGELHPEGQARKQGKSIAQAVREFGGPQLVMRHQMLWFEDSQREVIGRLERWYMLLAMLLTVALFVVAITVWRSLPSQAARTAVPSRKPEG
ncbi:MAG: hypothetical protein ABI589_06640 [Burkholderiales bacterium]